MAEVMLTVIGTLGVVKAVVGILTNLAADEFGLLWYRKDDLEKLKNTLEAILVSLNDGKNKQVNDLTGLWLTRLKDIAYDIEDVADEVSYKKMRRERRNRFDKKLIDFFSSSNRLIFSYRVAKKVEDINKRLGAIKDDNNLSRLPVTANVVSSVPLSRRQTSPRVTESIIGREADKNEIIRLLTTSMVSSSAASSSAASSSAASSSAASSSAASSSAASSSASTYFNNNQYPEKVSVVSIVGMGGVGKTTLAGQVYEDKDMEIFDPKIWVCVAGNFDTLTVLSKIIKCGIPETSGLEALENKVEEQLKGKKYLLVLDDMWNVRADEWEKLTRVLAAGDRDSKVLITTREVQESVKGRTHPYRLKGLRDDECWSIIKNKAFSEGGANPMDGDMHSIGDEIAKKCRGLPLAAKSLGSLMHSKNNRSAWESIRDKDIWKRKGNDHYDIIAVLKLSYDNLSPELQQCFSYCAIFPKNWEINRVTLVQLWIAEGFLNTCDVGNEGSIEDFADEFFESLVWCSFLDGVRKGSLDDIVTCKMHDLVHDLAKSVTGDLELATLKVSELNNTSKIRRLRLIQDADLSSTFLKSSSHKKKLRTVFIPECSKQLDPTLFSGNKYLRILHVGRSSTISGLKLPCLSLKLKHLRYLHLSFLDLREVASAPSINKLYTLETLVLTCMHGVEILLSNIQSLQKLRYLEVSWTDMAKLPDSVTSLSTLQTLDLNHSDIKVIPGSISGLKNLKSLNLSFNKIEELPISITTLSNLETLDVNTCKNLKALPEYVAGLAKLRIFDFQNCTLLRSLPEDIGALTRLRYLNLHGTAISVLPESCANLSNLEFLYLFNCELPKDVKNWTKLRRFYHYQQNKPILGVGKLVFLEELIYTVPEKVINEPEWNAGIEELGSLNFLETLCIWNLHNVKNPIDAERANLKGKQNLRHLYLIWACSGEKGELWDRHSCNFQVFEALRPPAGLTELIISHFMGRDLPTWMCVPSVGLPNLEWLELVNCKGIKQLPASIGKLPRLKRLHLTGMSLKSLHIGGFSSLIHLDLTDLFLLEELSYSHPSLQCLWIIGCKILTGIPSFPSLTQLVLEKVDPKLVCSVGRSQITSLTKLFLDNIEELIYFPFSILQNNSNLQTLQIRKCNQCVGFRVKDDDENDNEVALYGSLQILIFMDCSDLKFLPDLRGWTSLQKLTFFNCPKVKESLTYDLKSLSFLKELWVDFIQRDEQHGDISNPDDLINLMKK